MPRTRAAAWFRENSDAIAVEAACIERNGIPGSHLALNYPDIMEVSEHPPSEDLLVTRRR